MARGGGGGNRHPEQSYLHWYTLPTHTLALKGLPLEPLRAQTFRVFKMYCLLFVFLNHPFKLAS